MTHRTKMTHRANPEYDYPKYLECLPGEAAPELDRGGKALVDLDGVETLVTGRTEWREDRLAYVTTYCVAPDRFQPWAKAKAAAEPAPVIARERHSDNGFCQACGDDSCYATGRGAY